MASMASMKCLYTARKIVATCRCISSPRQGVALKEKQALSSSSQA